MKRCGEEHIHPEVWQPRHVAEQILQQLIQPQGFAVRSLLQHAIPDYLSEYAVLKDLVCPDRMISFHPLESRDHEEIW